LVSGLSGILTLLLPMHRNGRDSGLFRLFSSKKLDHRERWCGGQGVASESGS
jgi:hypothetical protein